METVSFGQTGLKVSQLCFGTMTIGSSKWKPWVLDKKDAKPILKTGAAIGTSSRRPAPASMKQSTKPRTAAAFRSRPR